MTGNPPVDASAILTWRLGCTLGGSVNPADVSGVGGNGLDIIVPPDGQLTVDDFITFVNVFASGTGCPGTPPCNAADITGIGGPPAPPDGELTSDDLITFGNSFSAGCEAE